MKRVALRPRGGIGAVESAGGKRRGSCARRPGAAVLEKGMTGRAAALHFEVSEPSIWRWIRRYRERGHLRDAPRSGRPSRTERERISRLLKERPDLSVRALQGARRRGLVFDPATLHHFLKRHGLQRARRWLRRLYMTPDSLSPAFGRRRYCGSRARRSAGGRSPVRP